MEPDDLFVWANIVCAAVKESNRYTAKTSPTEPVNRLEFNSRNSVVPFANSTPGNPFIAEVINAGLSDAFSVQLPCLL